MADQNNLPVALATRDRVGLYAYPAQPLKTVASAVEAEVFGVQQIWTTVGSPGPDALTTFAAVAAKTTRIRFGTSIVPTYPRHPLAMIQQVLSLEGLAPRRLRLGIGTSHKPIIEGQFGLPMSSPLGHLREYLTILRAGLWEGRIDFEGKYFKVHATTHTTRTPLLISALRGASFRLAGELSDGAISWICPVPYLLEKALPAMQIGAERAERPTPPLVAHVLVALNKTKAEIKKAIDEQFDAGRYYGLLPFYAQMFEEAGFPVAADGSWSEELIDNLVVSGDEQEVTNQLKALLDRGLDELLIMPIPASDQDGYASMARLIGLL